MPLYKLTESHPNYRQEFFQGRDVKGLTVYADRTNEKIGTVDDLLLDESGYFRYLVVDTNSWIAGKKVLLPIGQCAVDLEAQRVYATGLTQRERVENLPRYDDRQTVDYDYEERVRTVYRTVPVERSVEMSAPVEMSVPVESSRSLEEARYTVTQPIQRSQPVPPPQPVQRSQPVPPPQPAPQPIAPPPVAQSVTPQPIPQPATPPVPPPATQLPPPQPIYNRDDYRYDLEPNLYGMNDQQHQPLRLYEERLVAQKKQQKTGEVVVRKQVETEMQQVTVPVRKERLVVEKVPSEPSSSATPTAPSAMDQVPGNMQGEEVARIDLYEEAVDIQKRPVVREEVILRKERQHDVINAQETVRREELDINTSGNPNIDRG
jgi:uncharacterized protein (TIGR02271 family)